MTLPRSAADVLADHVLFEIEAIDRMYLNVYQPRLQHGAGIAAFFVGHRGHRFASSALMAPMTAAFTADIGHFIAARGLDLVRFAPGQRKDLVTAGYLQRAELDDRGLVPAQVLYVGVAQEKQKVFRTSKRRNPVTGATYPWLVPGSGVVKEATGTQVLQYGALFLRAFQGREADVSRLSDITVRDATAGGQGTAIEPRSSWTC